MELSTLLSTLYFTLPLSAGVVIGTLSGALSASLSPRRTFLVGLGTGLIGTGIVAVTVKLYGYYWDNLSGLWYDPSLMDQLMKEMREVIVALPVIVAVLTSAASVLICR